MIAPHRYVGWPASTWRTCQLCGGGANASIHRHQEPEPIKCAGCEATTTDSDKWAPDAETGETFCDPCWDGCYHCGRRTDLRPYLTPSLRVCAEHDLRPTIMQGR